jgi:hypothetical protein
MLTADSTDLHRATDPWRFNQSTVARHAFRPRFECFTDPNGLAAFFTFPLID